MSGSTVRVLVVERHAAVRLGLRAVLEAEPGLTVVGRAAAGADEALVEIERLLPDVVLLDLCVVDRGGGCALLRAVHARSPDTRIVILSALEGERKDAFREELIAAIRTGARPGLSPPAEELALSHREIDILRQVARGRSNPDIAAALRIAEGTVKTHLRRIFVKLGVRDRTAAAITALKKGAIRL